MSPQIRYESLDRSGLDAHQKGGDQAKFCFEHFEYFFFFLFFFKQKKNPQGHSTQI